MRFIVWMAAGSLFSWLGPALFVQERTAIEILCGMIGPLFAVCVTAIVVDRTFSRHPEASTSILIGAFASKLVFFLVYVTVMIRILSLRPIPFVASFTTYFIVLYFVEALRLRRLFWGGMRA